MPLQTGQNAPEFSLYNTEKNKISLADFKGKKNVLVLFFPLAFTSVCTSELCTIRDDIKKYQNEQTEVLGISVDSTYTLARYKDDQHYSFDLLSDFNKVVSNAYDVVHVSFGLMEMFGVSKRSAFIIDKNGVLQYAEVLENPGKMPDFEAIDSKLVQLAES